MATWTIRVNAQSGQGEGTSGTHATTLAQALPGDFDGAVITNIALSGAGNTSVTGASDDTIGVRFNIETSTGTDIYGGVGSDAASLAFAAATASAGGSAITLGSSTSPAPTTAVAADWDNVQWSVVYNRSGKADGATIAWGQFDIVVTYLTPLTAEPPSGSVSTASDAPTVTKTNFKVITPGTAAVTTEGQTPFRAYGLVTASEAPTVTIDAGTGTSITPASGSVSAVGQNLTLDTGIAVGSGSVAATGNAPTLDTSIAIPERTNLIKQSQTLDVASWVNQFSAFNADATTAPDGTATAERLIDDNLGGSSSAVQGYQNVTLPEAGTYTFSGYCKADQLTWVHLRTSGFDTNLDTWFDLGTGATGTSGHSNAGIEDAGNGWYRCWVVFSTTTDLAGSVIFRLASADSTDAVDRDGTSSIFVWGAQLEAADTPTTYIPTTTAAVSAATKLAVASQAPSVSFGRTIEVPVGSATIAGQTPTLGIVIQVPSGTVVTQGQDIAVSIGEVIPVPVATVVLEGQSVDVIEGNIRAPPTGALVAVGQSFTLDTGILVDSGSASITGNAITLDVAVSVPSGSAATASEAPTPSIVEGGKSITPDSASVSISGQSFTLDTSILVDSGAVTVTGQPITLSGQFLAQPGPGAVVTASDAPTLGLSIAVPSGSVTTQGNAPTLGSVVQVDSASATVSGQTLTLDTSVLVGSGSAVTASQAPVLAGAGTIVVPSGAVTTQGYAPTVTITAPAVEAPRKTGGRTKGRKRYYVVEIDGEDFIVNTVAEAQYLLMQAREMAGQVAEKAVQSTPTPPRVAIKTAKGKATTSKTLQKEVRRTQQAINAIYRRAAESVARTEEIARLMHERLREEDEEDAITALLLS